MSWTRDSAGEDVSGSRAPVRCQNRPEKGVQEDQRYVHERASKHEYILLSRLVGRRNKFPKQLPDFSIDKEEHSKSISTDEDMNPTQRSENTTGLFCENWLNFTIKV